MQIQSFINIRQDPKADFVFGLVAVNILALGYVFGFLNPGDIDTDGGIFSAIAYKDLHGGILYENTWENKPPGVIYLMELFFTVIHDKVYALYGLAIFGILIMVNGLYFLIKSLVGSLSLSVLLIIIFIYYSVNSLFLGDGLYTEIFGCGFILWAFYFYHLSEESPGEKYHMISALLAGFSFWMKEPFLFVAFPIVILLLLRSKGIKEIFRILASASVPTVLFTVILWSFGSLSGFIQTMIYNFSIVGTDLKITKLDQLGVLWQNILNPLLIPVVIFLIYAFRSVFKRESRIPLIFNLSLIAAGLAFIMISPEKFNHYYLPFIVIFFYCLASLLHYEKKYFNTPRLLVYMLLIYFIKKTDDEQSRPFKTSFESYKEDNITKKLRQYPSKTLFIDLVSASEYYIKGEKVFPAFIPVPVAIHFNDSEQGVRNRKRIYEELRANLPDFLIIGESSSYMYWHVPDPKLYYGNYEKIDSALLRYNKKVVLWKRK